MLHVASVCTACCVLLGVFAQSLKPVKRLSQQLPTFPLFRDRVALQCWIGLHSSFQHCWGHASALHMVYNVLRVVSFPRCTADPNIIGSCCVLLHTTANTDETTSNIVGPTMLRVVGSVYTSPLVLGLQILARLYQRCLTSCHLRLVYTGQQFAATRCGDTWQRQISVVENFCENLCLRNRILSP